MYGNIVDMFSKSKVLHPETQTRENINKKIKQRTCETSPPTLVRLLVVEGRKSIGFRPRIQLIIKNIKQFFFFIVVSNITSRGYYSKIICIYIFKQNILRVYIFFLYLNWLPIVLIGYRYYNNK